MAPGETLFVGAIVVGSLYAIQALISSPQGSEAKAKAILATVQPGAWHFVALQYYGGILNRTFVVFVTHDTICGVRVRGALPAPVNVTDRWHDPLFYPQPKLLAKYEGVDLESPGLLAKDKANFRFRKDEIERVEFTSDAKWGMGSVPYSGRLIVTRKGGVETELILLGTQDGPALHDRLRAEGFGVPVRTA